MSLHPVDQPSAEFQRADDVRGNPLPVASYSTANAKSAKGARQIRLRPRDFMWTSQSAAIDASSMAFTHVGRAADAAGRDFEKTPPPRASPRCRSAPVSSWADESAFQINDTRLPVAANTDETTPASRMTIRTLSGCAFAAPDGVSSDRTIGRELAVALPRRAVTSRRSFAQRAGLPSSLLRRPTKASRWIFQVKSGLSRLQAWSRPGRLAFSAHALNITSGVIGRRCDDQGDDRAGLATMVSRHRIFDDRHIVVVQRAAINERAILPLHPYNALGLIAYRQARH